MEGTPLGFEGLRVLSLESRRAKEMELLIRRYDGDAFVAPSVKERALDDNTEAFLWAEALLRADFDMVIFMTGVGLSYLRDAVLTRYSQEQFADALRKLTIVSRGPKPLSILHEMGVQAQVRIAEPNTWREIVPVVEARQERRIAIQEYGRPNVEFAEALRALGAQVMTVSAYRWELPEDIAPLQEAVRRVAERRCDVVIFTTSIQLVHLLEVARPMGLEDQVRKALRDDLPIASVGPIMNAALVEHGLEPDIVPVHPKMGVLVKVASEQAAAALARKRSKWES